MASVTEQLKDLAGLFKDGLITREEFDEQKQLLLEENRARVSTPPVDPPAPAHSSDLSGQRIGEYRLGRKLGEGGMGAVYLAAHEALEQRVAVKVLYAALARSEEVRTRFIQEANIQIQLQHPGIVRVLTASTQGEHLALVMEVVEGLTLEQALRRHGRLPLDRTLPLVRQVLDAVGYAHTRGVVHRDLKPSNIMVQPDGQPKVMDFGIAKVLGGTRLTRTGTLMGTAMYMSPEQVLGRSDIDHRTDIYSLGVTFFEMLTGKAPFEEAGEGSADSDFLIKQAHVQGAPPDPRSVHPGLPDAVARVLLRALEKAPDRRFDSCEEFASALGPANGGSMPSASYAPAPGSAEIPSAAPPASRPVEATAPETPPRPVQGSSPPAPDPPATARPAVQVPVPRMIAIEPGTFWIGSPREEQGRFDDEERHQVRLTRRYRIARTPVTQELYEAVIGRNPSLLVGPQHPVEEVSWTDALSFCNALSELEGWRPAYIFSWDSVIWDESADGYRLPTEAEWEVAAREDGGHAFAGVGEIDELAWTSTNANCGTHPVGDRRVNGRGLCDMSGNVWEWVWDRHGDYPEDVVSDPTGPTLGSNRVCRGGSWLYGPRYARVASRFSFDPERRSSDLGFRLARFAR